MNKIIFTLIVFVFTVSTAISQSIESKIRDFARNEYPNDSKMQEYVYKKQMSAYRYMLTINDSDVKQIAENEYPNDYAMQQYTYDKKFAAKNYMKTVNNNEVKQIAYREYPNDHAMQKYTYDKQLAAKNNMNCEGSPFYATVKSKGLKISYSSSHSC